MNNEIGKLIKKTRTDCEITAKELAERLKVNPTLLSRYENGKIGMTFVFVEKAFKEMGYQLKCVKSCN